MPTPETQLPGARQRQPRLPASVRVVPGPLETLQIVAGEASASLTHHGAHLTSWQPAGHQGVIFTSREARFEPGVAIRGGIPICFPWFGAGRDARSAPPHGFARLQQWRLVTAMETGERASDGPDGGGGASPGGVEIVFELTDDVHTRQTWPHSFVATYRLRIGRELSAGLTVRNTGPEPLSYEAALHTYLAVGDYLAASIHGLEGVHFDDLAHQVNGSEAGPVQPTGSMDRVYLGTEADVAVRDPQLRRTLHIRTTGSRSTIVWNPGPHGAARFADMAGDEWQHMVCVESANVREDAVVLAPGEQHTLELGLSVGELD